MRIENLKQVVISFKEICAGSTADGQGFDVSAPDAMCVHSSVPAQSPRIDVSKYRSPESVAFLVKKLKGTQSG